MKKLFQHITIFFAFTLFLTINVVTAQTPQDITKTARESTVILTMDNGNSGSGFFIAPDLIVTSYHVIKGASSGHVSPILQKEKYPIVGIFAIGGRDELVILKVSGAQGKPLLVGDSKTIKVPDPIYVVDNTVKGGIVTLDKIDKIIERFPDKRPFVGLIKVFLVRNSISSKSSGVPVLNDKGRVIGISKGTISDKENPDENLNVVIPSEYLTQSLERRGDWPKRQSLKPLSMEGVSGTHLTWGSNHYEFTLHNQRNKSINAFQYLIIFKDENGEIICADRFKLHGSMGPGKASRHYRTLLSIEAIDRGLDYDPRFSDFIRIDPFFDFMYSLVSSRTKQLIKSYEIRILDFDIDMEATSRDKQEIYITVSQDIPSEGVSGGKLTWFEKEPPDPLFIKFSYSLKNHNTTDVKRVSSYVVFYDKEGQPINESGESVTTLPATETVQIRDSTFRSIKQLTESYEIKVQVFPY